MSQKKQFPVSNTPYPDPRKELTVLLQTEQLAELIREQVKAELKREKEKDVYHIIKSHFIQCLILVVLFLDTVVVLGLMIWAIIHLFHTLPSA